MRNKLEKICRYYATARDCGNQSRIARKTNGLLRKANDNVPLLDSLVIA